MVRAFDDDRLRLRREVAGEVHDCLLRGRARHHREAEPPVLAGKRVPLTMLVVVCATG